MDVKALPYLSSDTCKTATTECVYFGYTGVPTTDPIITELAGFFTASEPKTVVPKFYTDETAMRAAYDASPVSFVVGVVFQGPSTNLTKPSTPASNDLYQYTILANHTTYVHGDYIDSRFATAQVRKKLTFVRYLGSSPTLSVLAVPRGLVARLSDYGVSGPSISHHPISTIRHTLSVQRSICAARPTASPHCHRLFP